MYNPEIEQYRQMQKNYYENFDPRHDQIIKAHVIGCYEEHQKYPYENYLLRDVPTGGGVALDFGCGPGRMIIRMSPFFERVDGVDISAPLIEAAKRWTENVPNKPNLYVNDGVMLLDVPSETYDLVYSVIAFHHIASYQVRMSLLKEFFRVLKPGGRMCIQFFFTFNPRSDWMQHADWRESRDDAQATNGYHDVRVTPENLPQVEEDLKSIGFVDFSHTMAPYPDPPHPQIAGEEWIFIYAKKP